MLQHTRPESCVSLSLLCRFWLVCLYVCIAVDVHQWMWAVSAIGGLLAARLLSQQGLAVQPAYMLCVLVSVP